MPLPSPRPPPSNPKQPDPETLFPASPAGELDPLRDPFNTDDKTLDELLADLGPEDQWRLDPDEPRDIQKLLDEASDALPRDAQNAEDASEDAPKQPWSTNYLTRDLDLSSFALDDGETDEQKRGKGKGIVGSGDVEEESREALDIVARMLDEIKLEQATEAKNDLENPSLNINEKEEEEEEEEENEESKSLSLPSAPSTLPTPSKKSLDFDSDIAARMAILQGLSPATNELGLPSAPTFEPRKGVMKKKPSTDEDVGSWCIICQDDATVKCVGCEGDLYCAGCWKEGHTGPDVGWEEKRHRWVKCSKPN